MERTFVSRSNLDRVCLYLIVHGKEFRHIPGEGVTFLADDDFLEIMQERLVTCYGCSLKPIIKEQKK